MSAEPPSVAANDDALLGWAIVSERWVTGAEGYEITWSTPEGPVVMFWPASDCEA